MSRIFRGILIATALILAAATGAVYALSEAYLADAPERAEFTTPLPTDASSLEHGRHIARTRGCFGCHGQQLEGKVFEDWGPGRAVAINLARYAREHEPGVIAAAIRQGVGADGHALWSMPSYNFVHLADEDVAALIAYLRSAPVVDEPLPKARLGMLTRLDMVLNGETHMPAWCDQVPPLRHQDRGDPLAAGEYLAMTTCNECHGLDLRGQSKYGNSPDLAVVGAYSRQDFHRLMREGIALGGRPVGDLMGLVQPDRFAHFTDSEIDVLYAFLSQLNSEPVPDPVPWRPGDTR